MWKQFGTQFYVAMAVILVTIFLIYRAPHGKSMPLQKDILEFPEQFGSWQGGGSRTLDDKVMDILRVDNYLDRVYYDEQGRWISLYIGYFQDQKDGETIHSPRNCMPGSGWNFTKMQPVTLDIGGEHPLTVQAVRSILVHGENRMLTYYWYQSRGRFITSEYWHKFYLVYDGMRHNRTDGALVRVLAPLSENSDIQTVEEDMETFIADFAPILQYEYLPPGV
ncbi:EpsI family protein [candidate division KSB3 bacterium]|uniref:EpsI family protein n=1 Tax=candidate division KSB3 bacterium TaxID=2044937 RepID=A0A2G6KA59_9BACT|nr:MAG: EpsI family protein [candidate division KSB3 bacterium]